MWSLCLHTAGKRCRRPRYISNGKADVDSVNRFGSRVRYSCTAGYMLTGSAVRVCQGDGTWSGTDPVCQMERKYQDKTTLAQH